MKKLNIWLKKCTYLLSWCLSNSSSLELRSPSRTRWFSLFSIEFTTPWPPLVLVKSIGTNFRGSAKNWSINVAVLPKTFLFSWSFHFAKKSVGHSKSSSLFRKSWITFRKIRFCYWLFFRRWSKHVRQFIATCRVSLKWVSFIPKIIQTAISFYFCMCALDKLSFGQTAKYKYKIIYIKYIVNTQYKIINLAIFLQDLTYSFREKGSIAQVWGKQLKMMFLMSKRLNSSRAQKAIFWSSILNLRIYDETHSFIKELKTSREQEFIKESSFSYKTQNIVFENFSNYFHTFNIILIVIIKHQQQLSQCFRHLYAISIRY